MDNLLDVNIDDCNLFFEVEDLLDDLGINDDSSEKEPQFIDIKSPLNIILDEKKETNIKDILERSRYITLDAKVKKAEEDIESIKTDFEHCRKRISNAIDDLVAFKQEVNLKLCTYRIILAQIDELPNRLDKVEKTLKRSITLDDSLRILKKKKK